MSDETKRLQSERDNALALAGSATQLWERHATENAALKRRIDELELALAQAAGATQGRASA
jgi:hypothetical protein